jgi:hypothetical protein
LNWAGRFPINYLAVRLNDSERWRREPPAGPPFSGSPLQRASAQTSLDALRAGEAHIASIKEKLLQEGRL